MYVHVFVCLGVGFEPPQIPSVLFVAAQRAGAAGSGLHRGLHRGRLPLRLDICCIWAAWVPVAPTADSAQSLA